MAYRAIFAILIALLAACGRAPSHGIVTDAQYHPSWIQIIPGTPASMQCSGTPQRCIMSPGTPQQMIPHPQEWLLEITNEKNESGWRQVTQLDYERCNLQEHFPECTSPSSGDTRATR